MASEALATIAGIGDQPGPIRVQFVADLIDQLDDNQTDTSSAVLILDLAGLTGDRDILDDALTARRTHAALADGTLSPTDVDPELTCGRDEGRLRLISEAAEVYGGALAELARPRRTPAPVTA